MMVIGVKGGESARIECPKCNSKKVCKAGRRKTKPGLIQRHCCGECGYRFSGSLLLSATSDIPVGTSSMRHRYWGEKLDRSRKGKTGYGGCLRA